MLKFEMNADNSLRELMARAKAKLVHNSPSIISQTQSVPIGIQFGCGIYVSMNGYPNEINKNPEVNSMVVTDNVFCPTMYFLFSVENNAAKKAEIIPTTIARW